MASVTWQSIVNIMSFKQSIEDPWLNRLNEPDEEAHRLANNCKTTMYSKAIRRFDLLFKMFTLKLVDEDDQHPERHHANQTGWARVWSARQEEPAPVKNCLATNFHDEVRATRRFVDQTLLIFVTVLIAATYFGTKLLLSAYLLYEHDIVMKDLRLKLGDNSTCSAHEARRQQLPHLVARLNWLNEWMDKLDVQLTVFPGLGFIAFTMIGSSTFAFYYMLVVFVKLKRKIRADFMAFLYDPLNERNRVQADISKIINEILISLAIRTTRAGDSNPPRLIRIMVPGANRRSPHRSSLVELNKRQVHWSGRVSDLKFIELLIKIRKFDLVRPGILSSCWHWDTLCLVRVLLTSFVLLSFVCPCVTYCSISIIEVFERTKQRLEVLKCASWLYSIESAITASAELPSLTNESDKLTYTNYDQTAEYFIYLSLFVESKYYFGRRFVKNFIAWTIMAGFLSAWSILITIMFLLAILQKACWLLQIITQLKYCIRLASLYHESAPHKHHEWGERWHHDRLLECLTIAYINYELFRRQQKPLHELTSFLAYQASTYTGVAVFSCYLTATNIVTTFRAPILFCAICITCFMNIFLLTSSVTSKLNEKLMLKVMRLIGAFPSHEYSIVFDYPIALWRRQILSESEIRRFSTISLFGVHMSYEKLMAFNFYLLGIWLMITRPTHFGND